MVFKSDVDLRLVSKFLTVFFFLFAAACANAQEPMRLPVEPDKLVVVSNGKEVTSFDIEIAKTDDQKSAGLMHRVDLPKNRGMLFVFDDDSQRYFWMKNTPTPLDIIYADQLGKIVHIANNTVPFSTASISSLYPAKYAFEIHAGLAEELGIAAGDHLVHTIIEIK